MHISLVISLERLSLPQVPQTENFKMGILPIMTRKYNWKYNLY